MTISGGEAEPPSWRNLGEEPIVETPWFRLRRARVELPGERQLDHYLLRVPPLTMTAMIDDQRRVLLLWRYRFIPGSGGWELPSGIAGWPTGRADRDGRAAGTDDAGHADDAGRSDAGRGGHAGDLAATASRQALAESGWEAIEPEPLLTMRQHSGLTDSAVHIFVTRRAVHRGPPDADFEAERIEWIPLDDAPALIADGQVKDASTVAALLWLAAGAS